MGGTKATGKTIGEVEKITGIPKRELKYYIEQGLLQPSQKAACGCWLYKETDIQQAQLISLCRTLDFPVPAIRSILADPDSCWPAELEQQISRLTELRNLVETQLSLANRMHHVGVEEAIQIYCNKRAECRQATTAK